MQKLVQAGHRADIISATICVTHIIRQYSLDFRKVLLLKVPRSRLFPAYPLLSLSLENES